MKYAIRETILVEGKYDMAKVKTIFSSPVLTTRGFGIYHDRELIGYLKKMAERDGILVLTDGDASGNRIRSIIKSRIQGRVLHAYIPDVYGKESRKHTPSAEGKLGVEGMSCEVILQAVRRSGASFLGEEAVPLPQKDLITRLDLYEAGLLGGERSRLLREKVLSQLSLPQRMNVSSLLEAMNLVISKQEFFTIIKEINPQLFV